MTLGSKHDLTAQQGRRGAEPTGCPAPHVTLNVLLQVCVWDTQNPYTQIFPARHAYILTTHTYQMNTYYSDILNT